MGRPSYSSPMECMEFKGMLKPKRGVDIEGMFKPSSQSFSSFYIYEWSIKSFLWCKIWGNHPRRQGISSQSAFFFYIPFLRDLQEPESNPQLLLHRTKALQGSIREYPSPRAAKLTRGRSQVWLGEERRERKPWPPECSPNLARQFFSKSTTFRTEYPNNGISVSRCGKAFLLRISLSSSWRISNISCTKPEVRPFPWGFLFTAYTSSGPVDVTKTVGSADAMEPGGNPWTSLSLAANGETPWRVRRVGSRGSLRSFRLFDVSDRNAKKLLFGRSDEKPYS